MLTETSTNLLEYRDRLPGGENLQATGRTLKMVPSKGCLLTNADTATQSSLCKTLTTMDLVPALTRIVHVDVGRRG